MSVVNIKKMELKTGKLSIGIVGAGPAGSMFAYLMARRGYQVTLIERKKEVERKICGEYLCPKGVEFLEKLNLLDELCHGCLELNGMVLVSPDNVIIPSYFPQLKDHERGLSLNRQVFDKNILRLAIDHGAVFLADKTVTNVWQTTDRLWNIKIGKDEAVEEEIYQFDFLVAADGRQSKIGHLLGHLDQVDTSRSALHCYLPRKIDRGQRLGEMHILGDGSYCGLDPINDDEVNFSVVCNSDQLKKKKAINIINETIYSSKRLSAMFDTISDEKQNEIKVVSNLRNKNRFIAGNNLAYVGDAAGFIDPLTGEGIYNAISSSYLLADSVLHFPNLSIALENYKRKKMVISFQKNILNHFFQFLIKKPLLVRWTAKFLKKSPERANQFIGIIGNIHDPLTGFIKMLRS